MSNDLTSPPPPSGSPVEPTSVTPVPVPTQQAAAAQPEVTRIDATQVAAQPVVTQTAESQPAASQLAGVQPLPPTGAPMQPASVAATHSIPTNAAQPVVSAAQPAVSAAQPASQYAQQPASFQAAPQNAGYSTAQPASFQAAPQSAAQSAAQYASQPAAPYGAPAPQKKKKSKKPLIITLASIAAVAIIIAAVLISQEVARSNAYDQAVSSFDQGNYAGAYDEFSALGTYRDAADMAQMSDQYVLYEEAQALYAAGSYDEARMLFNRLSSSGVGNTDEWIDKCDYALAEQILAGGDPEAAREAFLLLGSFQDAAERADACTKPFPATGIVYQDSGSYYEYCAIDIDYKYSTGGAFYKVYSGDTLVASLFLNANTTARVYLKPGNYVLKEGTGDYWYGEALAFGKAGWYSVMTYNDSGTDYITLNEGDLVTITINTSTEGNVSDRDEDFSDF